MSNGIKTIGRDPFARHDVVREQVKDLNGGCGWCGNLSPKGKLYRYGVHRDGLSTRPEFSKGKFCSKGCHKSYHE